MFTLLAAADQSRLMQEQMTGAAMAMPPDPNKAFKVRITSCLGKLLPAAKQLSLVCVRACFDKYLHFATTQSYAKPAYEGHFSVFQSVHTPLPQIITLD